MISIESITSLYLKVSKELGQALFITLDARLGQESENVLLGGSGVASDNQQQIGSQVSHLESILRRSRSEIW